MYYVVAINTAGLARVICAYTETQKWKAQMEDLTADKEGTGT